MPPGFGWNIDIGKNWDFSGIDLDNQEYSEYFTKPPEQLTDEDWAEMEGAMQGYASELYGQTLESLANRRTGLRTGMGEGLYELGRSGSQAMGQSGFAGSGAINREIGTQRRSMFGSYGQSMRDIYGQQATAQTKYEKETEFDIPLQIAERQTAEQDRMNAWYQSQLNTALRLKELEPEFNMPFWLSTWGATNTKTTNAEIPNIGEGWTSWQYGAETTGSETINIETEPPEDYPFTKKYWGK